MVSQSPRLDLDYDPTVPTTVLVRLEAVARGMGLPLGQLELLGQDTATAELFISHAQDDSAWEFLQQVAWEALEARRVAHSVVPVISAG